MIIFDLQLDFVWANHHNMWVPMHSYHSQDRHQWRELNHRQFDILSKEPNAKELCHAFPTSLRLTFCYLMTPGLSKGI